MLRVKAVSEPLIVAAFIRIALAGKADDERRVREKAELAELQQSERDRPN
jgi:hypothetical protein